MHIIIKKKFWKMGGALVRVLDVNGNLIAKARQKSFKIREKINVFADENEQQLLFTIYSKKVIDFNTTIYIDLPNGQNMGYLQRQGMKSAFMSDFWHIHDSAGNVLGSIQEDSTALAFLRRFILSMIPQTFHIKDNANMEIASFSQKFNFFTYNATADFSDVFMQSFGSTGALSIAFALTIFEGKQK